MENNNLSPSPSFSESDESCNYDEEFSMEQSLFLSDSLKDLKNLRTQLYSAAEYFEVSYTNDEQKEIVVSTLKDYTINALVNTVDHLGSVTYRVTDLLDEKVDEVSGAELRVSCIEQETVHCHEHSHTTSKYHELGLHKEDDWSHLMNAVQTTIKSAHPSTVRKGRSPSPTPQSSSHSRSFSFTDKTNKQKVSEKRTSSPLRSKFPLLRSGSFLSRPATPNSSRPTTPTPTRPTTPTPSRLTSPKSSSGRFKYPSDPRKPSSTHGHTERDNNIDVDQYPSKSKRLFKALLRRRKSKHDDMLYTYLDEY
ncbi:hypothetical protein IFM89_015998 [Coptis chinensis]|uniref:RHD domain-containing protein n=1 Tax=Coptis chinensis TaxID=261450 RepID=A0A835LQF4_9MAGN|nr:hypothetical protein IFM89_015998 [Coptis chinensis]